MPGAPFACEAILCARITRCPRDGTPVLESSYAVPRQIPVWINLRSVCSVSVAQNFNGTQTAKTSMEWNERPRILSFYSRQSHQPNKVQTRPQYVCQLHVEILTTNKPGRGSQLRGTKRVDRASKKCPSRIPFTARSAKQHIIHFLPSHP